MDIRSFFSRLCHSPIPRLATVMLITLAWSSLAFCGEIHDAAKNGDLEKAKSLLKDNPDLVFSKDTNGLTPLHWAAIQGHKDMVELLLANKADVNARDNYGWTALHAAALFGQAGVTELLLANKADVNAKANDGWTPLHRATANGHKDVAEVLRQHGGHE